MDTNEAKRILEERGWPCDYILYAGTIDHPGKNPIGVVKAFEKLKEKRGPELIPVSSFLMIK